MKKVFIAILAIIYITTSTGAVLHMHYCMGELADWGLGHNESAICGKCGMKEVKGSNKGCCSHEQKLIKNVADQKTTQPAFQMAPIIAVAVPVSFIEIPSNNYPYPGKEIPVKYGLIRTDGVAVYIRHCVFII
ncbi:HYC_CC_PP family protein [Ferruginibacter sp.]